MVQGPCLGFIQIEQQCPGGGDGMIPTLQIQGAQGKDLKLIGDPLATVFNRKVFFRIKTGQNSKTVFDQRQRLSILKQCRIEDYLGRQ